MSKLVESLSNRAILSFRLLADVSVANALRRTILSDIETLVFQADDIDISVNTSRFTNELLKQRLGCVPIHSTDMALVGKKFSLALKNDTDAVQILTTEAFSDKRLFPPATLNGADWYIDLARLRPKIASTPGEEIALSAKVSVSTAGISGQFNVVSTCSYGATQDQAASDAAFPGGNRADWNLLDAKRFVYPNSFDFVVESVGVFSNLQIVQKACDVIIHGLQHLDLREEASESTMPNCVDVIIAKGDYTLGKLLEWQVYTDRADVVKYVAFLKKHPHDVDGILRIATADHDDLSDRVRKAAVSLVDLFTDLSAEFGAPLPATITTDLAEFISQSTEVKRERLSQLKGVDKASVDEADDTELNRIAEKYSRALARKQKS